MTPEQSLRKFERRFAAIPDEVRKAVALELERNAEEIVAEMRRVAPVDDGDLRESIGWAWGDDAGGDFLIKSGKRWQAGVLRINIGAGGKVAPYARYVEFGTGRSGARPFFYPIWRLRRRRTRTRITRAMRKGIEAGAKA